jgi:hypothetical protein
MGCLLEDFRDLCLLHQYFQKIAGRKQIEPKQERGTGMTESNLPTLLLLRLLVGFLGERAQFAWWPTAFYEPSSRLFLDPVFSKTSRLAQYHGVLEASRRLHDEHLSVGSYHLFRLPEEVEQDLHRILRSSEGIELAGQVPRSQNAALDVLECLAAERRPTNVGPTSIGNIKQLLAAHTTKASAGAYLSALSQDTKTYPYLVG